jgi:hypothetical protein
VSEDVWEHTLGMAATGLSGPGMEGTQGFAPAAATLAGWAIGLVALSVLADRNRDVS